MKLSALAVARPVTTGMFFLAVLVLGLISFSRLAVDQLPDVTRPSVTVTTTYEGAAPDIVERQVTNPLEKVLATINNVKSVRSSSSEDSSKISLDFNWSTDVDLAALEVREKVNDTLRLLPEEIDPPRISKFDPSSWHIIYLNLTAGGALDRDRAPALRRDDAAVPASADRRGGVRRYLGRRPTRDSGADRPQPAWPPRASPCIVWSRCWAPRTSPRSVGIWKADAPITWCGRWANSSG